jgi:hypothetical protein
MFPRYVKSDRPGNKELPADGLAAITSARPAEIRPGARFVEAVARCESGSGQPLIGLPQRVAGASGTSPLWLPGACGSKC